MTLRLKQSLCLCCTVCWICMMPPFGNLGHVLWNWMLAGVCFPSAKREQQQRWFFKYLVMLLVTLSLRQRKRPRLRTAVSRCCAKDEMFCIFLFPFLYCWYMSGECDLTHILYSFCLFVPQLKVFITKCSRGATVKMCCLNVSAHRWFHIEDINTGALIFHLLLYINRNGVNNLWLLFLMN